MNLGKIAIWGAGDTAKKLTDFIERYSLGEIVAIADSDICKQEHLHETGCEVMSPVTLQYQIFEGDLQVDSILFAIRNYYLEDATSYFRFCNGIKGYMINPAIYFADRYDNVDDGLNVLLEIDMKKPRLKYVQTDVVQHCNLKCKSCLHHSNMLDEPVVADFDTVIKDWKRLKELFWGIYEFRIIGGEPLLCSNLIDYVKAAREIFPDSEISVVTNGILIKENEKITKLLTVMHKKNVKFDISVYEPMKEHLASVKKLLNSYGVKYVLNMTKGEFFKKLRRNPDQDIIKSHGECLSKNCHDVKSGVIYPCPRPSHIEILNEKLGGKWPERRGGFELISEEDGWSLKKKLRSPFGFCAYCSEPVSSKWEKTDFSNVSLDDWCTD